MTHLSNPLTVVTGGSSGIGLACAKRLLARGDQVLVMDLPQVGLPEELARLGAEFVACDVSREDRVRDAAAVIETKGSPAVLVNSAGIIQSRLAPEALDMQTWDRVIAVNQRGTYLCATVFGATMAKRGAGAIVNIASITAQRSVPVHAYAPAKAAVVSITQCLAAEWGRSGVRVNAVSPGYTYTPALQAAIERGDRDPAALTGVTALGRFVTTEEVANAVAFLTSQESSGITGVDLPVDAGWLVGTPWLTYGGLPAAR